MQANVPPNGTFRLADIRWDPRMVDTFRNNLDPYVSPCLAHSNVFSHNTNLISDKTQSREANKVVSKLSLGGQALFAKQRKNKRKTHEA